jgi:hypothetical protein
MKMERVLPSLLSEFRANADKWAPILERSRESNVTLLYGARGLRAQQRCGVERFSERKIKKIEGG